MPDKTPSAGDLVYFIFWELSAALALGALVGWAVGRIMLATAGKWSTESRLLAATAALALYHGDRSQAANYGRHLQRVRIGTWTQPRTQRREPGALRRIQPHVVRDLSDTVSGCCWA